MTDPKNLIIAFDARTLDAVVNAVGQLPYVLAAPILADIAQQVAAQQKGPQAGASESLPVLTDAVPA